MVGVTYDGTSLVMYPGIVVVNSLAVQRFGRRGPDKLGNLLGTQVVNAVYVSDVLDFAAVHTDSRDCRVVMAVVHLPC